MRRREGGWEGGWEEGGGWRGGEELHCMGRVVLFPDPILS